MGGGAPPPPPPAAPPQGMFRSGATALRGLGPYRFVLGAGFLKILLVAYHPLVPRSFRAPFAGVIGHNNAVALSMLVLGLFLVKLADVLAKKRWHETNVGLVTIVSGSLLAMVLLARSPA